MKFRIRFKDIKQHLDQLFKYLGYFLLFSSFLGFLAKIFSWFNQGAIQYVYNHFVEFCLVTLSTFVLVIWIWVSRLHKRFIMGFKDSFKSNIEQNWDYEGWHVTENHELVVTGSDAGGLTKVGAFWENYTLTFKSKILNKCIGVIVRAQDLNNYYMFQIKNNIIRPHRRVSVPSIEFEKNQKLEGENKEAPKLLPVKFMIGWEVHDDIATEISPLLVDWFSVLITVRGEAIHIYINDELVFHSTSLLKFPTGRIGFRNSGNEKALIKDVRVTLHP
jgi:hypothetical protein